MTLIFAIIAICAMYTFYNAYKMSTYIHDENKFLKALKMLLIGSQNGLGLLYLSNKANRQEMNSSKLESFNILRMKARISILIALISALIYLIINLI
ncbi:MAG: hypothetical protein Q4B52_00010 [Tissierellia bacterium]|nr:hypothetical protein [Tissierellia bacterium]